MAFGSGTGTLVFNASNATYSFAPVISGAGTINVLSPGVTTLTAASPSFTGATTINAGTLALSGAGSLSGASGIAVASGASFDISGTTSGASVATLSGAGTVALGGQTLTISNGSTTFAGILADGGILGGAGGSLTIAAGTQTLTGINSFTGATVVTTGATLALSGIGAIAASSGVYANGAFDISGTTSGASITTLSGAGTVALGGQTLMISNASTTFAGILADGGIHGGAGGSLTIAAGTQTLTGINSFTGATVVTTGATLALSGIGAIAASSGVASNGTLDISGTTSGTSITTLSGGGTVALGGQTLMISNASTTFAGVLADGGIQGGAGGSLNIAAGTQTLSGANTYSGGTIVTSGTIGVQNSASLGSGALALHDGTTLVLDGNGLNLANAIHVAGDPTFTVNAGNTNTISGVIADGATPGDVVKNGGGTLILTAANTYTGATTIAAGTLLVNGTQTGTGATTVGSGATLGGSGTLGGAVVVQSGGILSPGGTAFGNSVGTLTMGSLTLNAGAVLNYELGQAGTAGGAYNDLIVVNGNLTLGGTLNVSQSAGGTFGAGLYRLINYTGTLTNNGLALGTGLSSATNNIQTALAGQVNLVNSSGGQSLTWWNGGGTPNSGTIVGGSGVWSLAPGSTAWSNANGSLSGPGTSSASPYPIFAGTAGVVTVDDSAGQVTASGMQFAVSGYSVIGGAIALAAGADSFRVGDGTATGAGYTATIAASMTGTGQVYKDDLGTLILTGTNTYSGGTQIVNGTLQVSSDANLGAAGGALTIAGGTLATTASFSSARNVTLGGNNGTINVAAGTTLGLSGVLSGAGGGVIVGGLGTLQLSNVNTYTGPTNILSGTLALSGTGSIAASSGVYANGVFDISGTTSGASVATLSGAGTVALGGQTLTISNASTTFSGVLTDGGIHGGTGGSLTIAAGTQTLTGINSFTGATVITTGATLALSGTGAIAASSGVASNGTLDISGTTSGTSITTLSGAGTVALGGQTLTISNASTTFSGVLADGGIQGGAGGSLNIAAGTQTLSGANTYSGGTTVTSGTIGVQNSASLGSGALALHDGTTLVLDGNGLNLANAIHVAGDPTFTVNAGNTNTISGVIADGATPGDVVKNGGGTLILTAANTYTGATTIAAGTLVLSGGGSIAASSGVASNGTLDISGTTSGASITTLSGAGTVALGGQSLTITNASTTFAGILADGGINAGTGGSLTIAAGTQTLTGINTYTGGTVINTGATLALSGTGGIAASSGVYANGAFDISGTTSGASVATLSGVGMVALGGQTLTISNASTTFSGVLTDGGIHGGAGGSLTIAAGMQTLTGINTYTGGTVIAGGATLRGQSASFGTGPILSLGALVIDQSTNATLANTLAGTGIFTKMGAATLNLTGDSSGFAGTTTVAAGVLSVNGSLGGTMSVANAATLKGYGTVGSTVIQSGATIAPGNSIGTLTVNGNFVQAAGSTYQAGVMPGSAASDRIAVTGTATIAPGAVLSAVTLGSGAYVQGARYNILTATGGVTGTYAFASQSISTFFSITAAYDPNNVYLQVAQARTFAAAAQTPNQLATATALDALAIGNSLHTAVSSLSTDGSARAAFDTLSGQIYASAKSATIEDTSFLRDTASDRIRQAFDAVAASANPVYAYSEAGPIPVRADAPFAVWGRVFGAFGSTNSDGNAARLDQSFSSFLIGADVLTEQCWRLGVLGGYSQSRLSVDTLASSDTGDNYHLALYGGTQWGRIGLRAGLGYTQQNDVTSRSIALPGLNEHLRGSYNAGAAQAFGEVGYRFDLGPASAAGRQRLAAASAPFLALEPFAGLAYVNLRTDSFVETGGAAALAGKAGTGNVVFSTLGVRASKILSFAGIPIILKSSAGWRHAEGDLAPTANLAFTSGQAFTITGVPIAKDSALLESGIDANINDAFSLGISYAGQIAASAQLHTFKANLGWKF